MPSVNRQTINLNGGPPVTAVGKGAWIRNPFSLAFAHIRLHVSGAGSATVVIEGTLTPPDDGGGVPLFVSDPAQTWCQLGTTTPAATRPGTLTQDNTGDAGQLNGSCSWIRYNVVALSGTNAALDINVSGDM